MSKLRLVVIDTKKETYTAYEGRTRIDRAKFSRPLFADEVEAYRRDPAALTGEAEGEEVA